MTNINWNTLSGLIAILLWSTTVGLARSISEQVGPLTAGASVYLTGGVLASGWVLIRKNIFREFKRTSIKYLFVCGSLFVIYTISLFLALGFAKDRYQTLEIGLINYLWPALTLLIAIPVFNKRANFWLIPGTFIALTGVFFVIIRGEDFSVDIFIAHIQNNPVAYGIAMIAALSWALYSNLVRFISIPDSGGAVPFFILITGLMLVLLRFIFPEEGSFDAGIFMEISGLGIATALAYNLWENAMRKGDLILVVSVSYLTPFFSTVFTAFYLGILPGIYLWIGCLLIIAGSWLSWHSVNSRFVM